MFAARNSFLTPASVAVGGPTLGLTDSLLTMSGQNTNWVQRTINISSYANSTVRLVFYHYADYFTGDMQLDDIYIDGTTYDFEPHAAGWETTFTNSNTIVTGDATLAINAAPIYTGATFISVPTGGSSARWNRDRAGTGSSGTGSAIDHTLGTTSGWYVYAETSSPYPCGYWLKSPARNLGSSPTLSFWVNRTGATMRDCNVYLDIIS